MAALTLNDFSFDLPKERIAQEAVHPHDSCKFMVLGKKIEHKIFSDLVSIVEKGDVIVVNKTKVLHARMYGKKASGSKVELILMQKKDDVTYDCRIKGSRLHVHTVLQFEDNSCEIVEKKDDIFTVRFTKTPDPRALELVTPPYITAHVPEEDYQTMFAKVDGSLAAPTASLHFTPELVKKLLAKGVIFANVTLHVGFGTFLPIKSFEQSHLEGEYFEIPEETAQIVNSAQRVIAVGTTVLKALESASKDGKTIPQKGVSTLFIKPGHVFQSPVTHLITNFHLPKSSLLLLVCAFAGKEKIFEAYTEAVQKNYRFYSLGDAMIVGRKEN